MQKVNSPSLKISTASFDSYKLENGGLKLFYSWDDKYHFTHRIKIPSDNIASHNMFKDKSWEVWAFNLGLARFPYYFGPVMPQRVVIRAGNLTPSALSTWHSWYINGLAEFLYRNNLPFKINLSNEAKIGPSNLRSKALEISKPAKYMVMNGGGKDSSVAGELLKGIGREFTWVTLGLNGAQRNVIKNSNMNNRSKDRKNQIIISGKSDKLRNELKNKFSLFRGHQPLSLYLAFVCAFAARVNATNYIIAANEKSANHENLVFDGVKINHQFTKSYNFEAEFQNYIKLYLDPQLSYFSLLRPLYELQIVKLFSGFEQYHDVFISCNNTIKHGRWCGRCSKCAFMALALSPFLPEDKIVRIIGKNMLNDPEMLPRYLALCGIEGNKPFECVGTVEESLAAMWMTSQKYGANSPFIVEYFRSKVPQLAKGEIFSKTIMSNYDEQNLIPEELKGPLKQEIFEILNR